MLSYERFYRKLRAAIQKRVKTAYVNHRLPPVTDTNHPGMWIDVFPNGLNLDEKPLTISVRPHTCFYFTPLDNIVELNKFNVVFQLPQQPYPTASALYCDHIWRVSRSISEKHIDKKIAEIADSVSNILLPELI